MRLPAVAIAAVFASGAVLGQAEWFAKRASSHTFLTAGFVTVGVLLCGGIVLAVAEEQRFSGSAPEIRRAHFYASWRCGEASGERDSG
jgi:hypothetical protein